ncbi:MAG: hypothetical protein NDI69_12730 [Bacteriovoracaceae bacterium]|nr:hypothetical protein [Bacteriovoracaceae bacterium]
MKLFTTLGLAFALSSAMAGEEYGGINFHSSVPQDQVNALKADINYLYQTPVSTIDAEFQAMTGLPAVDGAHMHNWLINRSKHIIGESFQLTEENIAYWIFHRFPKTPLPDAFKAVNEDEDEGVVTVMSNIGSALYLLGKKQDVLLGLKLDGDKVYAKSTRAGILQVGKGLFLERFRINKGDLLAPANTVSRLGTLFHEARHSDGNSEHTGFVHDECPTGHAYEGHAACEKSSNGSYSLGAVAEKQLLLNCSSCSEKEKSAISAGIADAFSRIVDPKQSAQKAELEKQIKAYEDVLAVYDTLINLSTPEKKKAYEAEKKKIEQNIEELKLMLADLEKQPTVALPLDPAPEGKYDEISIKKSVKLIEKSLKK